PREQLQDLLQPQIYPVYPFDMPDLQPAMCCNRSVVISWPSRDAVGIFCKPSFYPNHRARNPHPGDGLDPLLGPRIFSALRLGPFEGFPASMQKRIMIEATLALGAALIEASSGNIGSYRGIPIAYGQGSPELP